MSTTLTRRAMLQASLAGLAGLTAGPGVLSAAAKQPEMVTVRYITGFRTSNGRVVCSTREVQLPRTALLSGSTRKSVPLISSFLCNKTCNKRL